MERLDFVSHPNPRDRVGEHVALFREFVDLTGLAAHARGDVVEYVRNGAQLLDSIHACTNTDGVIEMHGAERQKPAPESPFLD